MSEVTPTPSSCVTSDLTLRHSRPPMTILFTLLQLIDYWLALFQKDPALISQRWMMRCPDVVKVLFDVMQRRPRASWRRRASVWLFLRGCPRLRASRNPAEPKLIWRLCWRNEESWRLDWSTPAMFPPLTEGGSSGEMTDLSSNTKPIFHPKLLPVSLIIMWRVDSQASAWLLIVEHFSILLWKKHVACLRLNMIKRCLVNFHLDSLLWRIQQCSVFIVIVIFVSNNKLLKL